MVKIKTEFAKDRQLMKEAWCDTLIEMMGEDPRVCVLDADLSNSSGTGAVKKVYPDRMIQVGIMEAHMTGMAGGMSAAGMIPFTHTFGAFAARRCMDQVYVSGAYAKLNAKLVGTDPGLMSAFNGGTHSALEDAGLMCTVPEMTVVEPTDCVMTREITRIAKETYGMFYIRLYRKNPVAIYEPGSRFEIGKGVVLRDGTDVTIMASGFMVYESLLAAAALAQQGISARVVDMFTWKPIDRELIVRCAKETGAFVSAENHNTLCGLGAAVAGVLAAEAPAPLEKVGVHDAFGDVGDEEYLKAKYALTKDAVIEAAKRAVARKG